MRFTIVLMILFVAVTGRAGNGFTGSHASANWIFYQDPGGNGTRTFTPTTLTLKGSNANSFSLKETRVTIVAPYSGLYSFNWTQTTNDNALYEDAAYYINFFYNSLTEGNPTTSASGSMSFWVNAGDEFGFSIFSVDDAFGASTLTISNFSWPDPQVGCMEIGACNYNPIANIVGTCSYPIPLYDCNGICLADSDSDGVCNELEVPGCSDLGACNFNAAATDPGICSYPNVGYTCSGDCISDTDQDGVCDGWEIVGCFDLAACNYNPAATDAGECLYPALYYNCAGQCIEDLDIDGVCDQLEVLGCQDVEACNYNPLATNDGGCLYPPSNILDCFGNCISDADASKSLEKVS